MNSEPGRTRRAIFHDCFRRIASTPTELDREFATRRTESARAHGCAANSILHLAGARAPWHFPEPAAVTGVYNTRGSKCYWKHTGACRRTKPPARGRGIDRTRVRSRPTRGIARSPSARSRCLPSLTQTWPTWKGMRKRNINKRKWPKSRECQSGVCAANEPDRIANDSTSPPSRYVWEFGGA